VGSYVAYKRIGEGNTSKRVLFTILIVTGIMTLLGGRLFFLLFYAPRMPFFRTIIETFAVWKSGLVSLGGFLFGITTLLLLLKLFKIKILKFLDNIAPALAIGMFIARSACYVVGCCFGIRTTLPWGINIGGLGYHPTQIYSSFYCLIIFIILKVIEDKKPREGTLFASLMILYGFSRFMVEFIRFNPKILFGLALQQVITLGMIATGVIMVYFIYRKKHNKRK